MSKPTPTPRGDLMRRIAALHAEAGRAPTFAERQSLKKQIVALEKQMMAR